MRFVSFAILGLMMLGVVLSAPAKKTDGCNKSCPLDFTPVCAGPPSGNDKPKSFGNACVLSSYNCEQKTNWAKISDGECPGGGGVRLQ